MKQYREGRTQKQLDSVGIVKRFLAYIIDFYVGMLLCGLPIVLGNGIINQSDKMQINLFYFEGATLYIVAALSLLLGFWYYVYVPWRVWKGQTLAKHFLHIKIVKMDGAEVTLKSLLQRQVIGMFLVEGSVISCTSVLRQLLTYATSINFVDTLIYIGMAITIASCVVMILNKHRRMLHDFIGMTTVIPEM